MSVSITNLNAVTLFVDDLPSASAFYRDVFGLPVVHEDDDSTAFDFGNTIINLLRRPAASALIEPAAVADAAAGSHMQLTALVEDVDATCAALAQHGVRLLTKLNLANRTQAAILAHEAGLLDG